MKVKHCICFVVEIALILLFFTEWCITCSAKDIVICEKPEVIHNDVSFNFYLHLNASTQETENVDKPISNEKVYPYVENPLGKWKIGQEVDLPTIPTNMMLCTDYRFYNITGTPHNRLQLASYTDRYGMRRHSKDYVVGLGSYYTIYIGDRFEITLDTGEVFTIILGDGKADCDTDITNRYTPCVNYEGYNCANVIEFIIDDEIVTEKMYAYGSASYYQHLNGNIVSMKYIGRDTSGDWDTYY